MVFGGYGHGYCQAGSGLKLEKDFMRMENDSQ